MIPQLITELFEAKEFAAARELSIAYLRNEKNEHDTSVDQRTI